MSWPSSSSSQHLGPIVHTIFVFRTGASGEKTSSREMAVARRLTVRTALALACSFSTTRDVSYTPGATVTWKLGTTWLDAASLVITTSFGTPPMTATIAPGLHRPFSTANANAAVR